MDESICHICAICNRLLKQVEGRQMCPLRLEVGLEHDNGILSPEIGLPGVGVFHGYQINFVQDENDLFVRHGQYFAFNVLAPARKRVPCVEHLKDNIAILDDFFHFLPVFAGLLKVFGFEVASAFFVLLDVLLELPLLHVVLDVGQLLSLEILDSFVAVGLLALEGLNHLVFEVGEVRWLAEIIFVDYINELVHFLACPCDF